MSTLRIIAVTASLPSLAQPILDGLTAATDSATAVVVLDGDDVLYVAKASPPSYRNIVAMTVNIGHRRPAYITASGVVLLAHLDEDEFEDYLGNLDRDAVRTAGNRSIDDIRQQIEQMRQTGYSTTSLIFSTSMRALAVPVHNVVGKVVAAIVVAVYDERSSDEEMIARHLPRLKKAASSLSHKLVE